MANSLALDQLVTAEIPAAPTPPCERARALVNQHFDFLWRLLRRLGVPEADVDDAAQQVFIVATRRLTEVPTGSERTFLYGTALRTAATIRRGMRRRRRWIENVTVDAVSLEHTPHEALERRQALSLLDEVLSGLDDELREVFVLCEIEELSALQVAAIAKIPAGTVASRLRRARQAFAARLARLKAQESMAP
ncbi:MAG: sigma-70 family RNA polymerase sigma factor [Polyangiaceae bacterium]